MSLEAADSSWGHCWDSVQVFDGPDKDSPRLGSYCGTTLPPTLSSSTNVMTVLFDSDCSITADGFSATASVQSLAGKLDMITTIIKAPERGGGQYWISNSRI